MNALSVSVEAKIIGYKAGHGIFEVSPDEVSDLSNGELTVCFVLTAGHLDREVAERAKKGDQVDQDSIKEIPLCVGLITLALEAKRREIELRESRASFERSHPLYDPTRSTLILDLLDAVYGR